MKYPALLAFALLVPTVVDAEESSPRPASLKCDIGPLQKEYGKSSWFVYSCAYGKTLVIVTAPGSPAFEFYFMLYPKDGAYQLYGEGGGNKAATDAAYEDLKTLTEQEISAIIAETLAAPPNPSP